MTFNQRNWRGNFGSTNESSARSNNHFRKIEQVNKLEGVLKFSTPKDTEVIASMAATDF